MCDFHTWFHENPLCIITFFLLCFYEIFSFIRCKSVCYLFFFSQIRCRVITYHYIYFPTSLSHLLKFLIDFERVTLFFIFILYILPTSLSLPPVFILFSSFNSSPFFFLILYSLPTTLSSNSVYLILHLRSFFSFLFFTFLSFFRFQVTLIWRAEVDVRPSQHPRARSC